MANAAIYNKDPRPVNKKQTSDTQDGIPIVTMFSRSRSKKKNKQNEELQKQNEELQRLNGELKVEVDDLKHQNAQMRNELDTLNELQVEVDDLKYQNAYMRNELGTLNELIDTAGVKSNILFGGVDPN